MISAFTAASVTWCCAAQRDFSPFTYMGKETSVTLWIIFLSVQTAAKWLVSSSGFDPLGLITLGKSRRAVRLDRFSPVLASGALTGSSRLYSNYRDEEEEPVVRMSRGPHNAEARPSMMRKQSAEVAEHHGYFVSLSWLHALLSSSRRNERRPMKLTVSRFYQYIHGISLALNANVSVAMMLTGAMN